MSSSSLVISDTSSIILLDKIDELDILKQSFDKVYTTPVVAREFGIRLPEWITVQNVTNTAVESLLNKIMDPGEASVLALATEIDDCYVLVDDNKARNYAEKTGQKFLGTLGLILRAKRLGVIPSVRPYLEKVRQTNFLASAALYELILEDAGEA
jgi:predicted nucleic acid-binding protein